MRGGITSDNACDARRGRDSRRRGPRWHGKRQDRLETFAARPEHGLGPGDVGRGKLGPQPLRDARPASPGTRGGTRKDVQRTKRGGATHRDVGAKRRSSCNLVPGLLGALAPTPAPPRSSPSPPPACPPVSCSPTSSISTHPRQESPRSRVMSAIIFDGPGNDGCGGEGVKNRRDQRPGVIPANDGTLDS